MSDDGAARAPDNRFKPLGIVSGSGPEAGIDLQGKIVACAKTALGSEYSGDKDAPFVLTICDPVMGLTSDLEAHLEAVKDALRAHLDEMCSRCALFTVACNVLQPLAKGLVAPERHQDLLTFDEATQSKLRALGSKSVFLIGASAVMDVSKTSVYKTLVPEFEVATPKDWALVDSLIADIKVHGGSYEKNVRALSSLYEEAGERTVVLACTDLPLVPAKIPDGLQVIDPNRELARLLIERSLTR